MYRIQNSPMKKSHYLLYSLQTMRFDGKPIVALDFLLIPDNSSSLQVLFLFMENNNNNTSCQQLVLIELTVIAMLSLVHASDIMT